MTTRIEYCRDCPMKKAKVRELKGPQADFFFTPSALLEKCYSCHFRKIEESFERQKEVERIGIKEPKD